ncbi:hypothetical protein M0805_001565, partial [Coniferiporia weirii]
MSWFNVFSKHPKALRDTAQSSARSSTDALLKPNTFFRAIDARRAGSTLSVSSVASTPSSVLRIPVAAEPSTTGTTSKRNHEPVAKAEPTLSAYGNYVPPLGSVVNSAVGIVKTIAAVAPVPWLGPAVDIVENILQLCDKVSKNKHGVEGLAKHCSALLDILKEMHISPDPNFLQRLQSDLESLLTKVKGRMEEWGRLNRFEAFVQQEAISKEISIYYTEIDQFCSRHTLAVHIKITNWQENYEKQIKQDREDLKGFLSDLKNARELENMCRREEIAVFRDDFLAFFTIVQKTLLELKQGSTQDDFLEQRKSLESNFSTIYRASGMLPPGMEFTKGLIQMEEFPQNGNAFFDIYRGTCFGDVKYQCAFKVVRHVNLDDQTRRRFNRQLEHWQSIQDLAGRARMKNEKIYVLPLIGAIHETFLHPFLCLISPWMNKGNAYDYVKRQENVDRIALVRKIALGLKVLHGHNPPLAHGYVRGSNILIDDMCDPLLSDFGLMRVVEDAKAVSIIPSSVPADSKSHRWLSPELLGLVGVGEQMPDGETFGNILTTKSDIFMYGMTVLELMTGEPLYSYLKHDHQVTIHRSLGELPEKPDGKDWEKVCARGLDE